MSDTAQFTIEDDSSGGLCVVLSGPHLVSTISNINKGLREIDGPISVVDLSGVTAIDTVGAWSAFTLAARHDAQIIGTNERSQRLLDAVQIGDSVGEAPSSEWGLWQRVPVYLGTYVGEVSVGLRSIVGFLGQIILAAGTLLRHPGRFRGKALVCQLEWVGVSALPIVGLMSFLIGIVIAQQGAAQLAQFGAETLTVNLVGRITLRELGVLMTAIMVAGRSGSAFAAQIGTMKLTEEVDAMRTIGIAPVEALVIPRILASVLMMPLLGFYAAVVAIVGGAVIGEATLGIPFWTFLERIEDVVPVHDLWVGLIKAPVFGLIIGISGCYHGMQVTGDSEQVGKRTTQAVVSAIFMVIVLDAFFAVFFTEIGWG